MRRSENVDFNNSRKNCRLPVKMSSATWATLFLYAFVFLGSCESRRWHNLPPGTCQLHREGTLEYREERAAFVFTGTVLKVHRRPERLYWAEVLVRRVLKGDRTLAEQEVMVEGFGNERFCSAHVRKKDTRIFFAIKLDDGKWKLNSSLVGLTIENMDKITAAVQDTPYQARPPINEAPCEKMYCAFGAVCLVDKKTNEAYCKCQETCAAVFAPVCGSDDVTYSSECQLRMASCNQQKRILVKYKGPCAVKDPCENKVCRFGSRCTPTLDGRSAECVCPDKCPTYGDHRGALPVCATDGKDYPNVCELRRAACQQMKDIQERYQGKCDPCEGVDCPAFQVCQLDEHRNPLCRCNGICTMEFRPVCGSDGKTYSNECIMRVEACKARKNIRIIYRGECSSGVNPCVNLSCLPGQECEIDRFGIATCECPPVCEAIMRPVCGDDAITYDNECEMTRASCIQKKSIHVFYLGPCGQEGPCNGFQCNFGAMCVVKSGQPVCECPTCSAEFKPVCGSDGISYNNECKLKLDACQQKKDIKLLYQGLCNGCENTHCDFYSICESNGKGSAKCVCPQSCVQVEAKVCGTDGVSYTNECELKVAACKKQQLIVVASRGNCDLCQNVHCKFGARCENGQCVCPTQCPDTYEPVCANDGSTYTNECFLQKASCQSGQELEVLFYGDCDDISGTEEIGSGRKEDECDETTCGFGGTCEYDAESSARCICNVNCHLGTGPVLCGSDGHLYNSECELREEMCNRQREIKVQSLDFCRVSKPVVGVEMLRPCDGHPPMVNPLTRREYFCGDSPYREDCPSGTYCHRAPDGRFAKCCRNEATIKSCSETAFGCCPDGKTAALGSSHAGCPSVCKCNKLGSYGETCDPSSKQCTCKPGVGGLRCDRCEPGFWGLPKISEGNSGCIPCGCSLFGSVRDDCEQMTGRCVCKPGISGMKCNICPEGQILGPNGCSDVDISTPVPRSCRELRCFFGAKCEEHDGHAECVCDSKCPETSQEPVCGSDGQTYGSECQLQLFACRYQRDIVVRALGPCQESLLPSTEPPWRRSTLRKTTDVYEYTNLSKSTRHLGHSIAENYISTKPTSATPRKGLIGDICFRDKDCMVMFSRCNNGLCDCREGYFATPDTHQCLAQDLPVRSTPESTSLACSSYPCQNGATCLDELDNTFRCICPAGRGGVVCTEIQGFETPAFSGKSYIEMRTLSGHSQVTFEMEFRTFANDGILLYNGQHSDGQGDFISLSIKQGFIEFRYNLGNGPVVIRSTHKVMMKKFHKVVAKRFHRDGMLRLDDYEDVSGKSQGTHKSLDLLENLFLGYVPSATKEVFENVGVSMGLVGCIRKLKLWRKEIVLKYPGSKDIIRGAEIGECGDNPCASMPCRNGATCMALGLEHYKCMCQSGYTGKACEITLNPCTSAPCAHGSTCVALPQGGLMCKCAPGRKGELCQDLKAEMHDVYVPDFDGQSYIELPTLQNVGQSFAIEIWFLSRALNGLLLYNGQLTNGKGDFISLNLINGYLQYRYDLGSGMANITSPEPLQLGEWHSAKITRYNRKGTLQINDGSILRGESGPPLNELNLELPLNLGGYKLPFTLNRDAGIVVGLNGAVQRLTVNGEVYETIMERARESYGVKKYVGPPCLVNPCENGGICLPLLRDFECRCPMKFIGKVCDKVMDDVDMNKPIAFDGHTHLKFRNKINRIDNTSISLNSQSEELVDPDLGMEGQPSNRFIIRFRTTEENGLLLWLNKGSTVHGDYFAIAIVGGHAEISYNLGMQKQTLIIRSRTWVSDGEWHQVKAERRKRSGTLRVDTETPVTGTSDVGATVLNTDGILWIGGSTGLPAGLPLQYYSGFRGCIEKVKIDNEELHLVMHGDNNVQFCVDN